MSQFILIYLSPQIALITLEEGKLSSFAFKCGAIVRSSDSSRLSFRDSEISKIKFNDSLGQK